MSGPPADAARRTCDGAVTVPLWHLVPIGLLLIASSFFVGHDGYVFIDEAALLAQVDLVADGRWVADRPLADVDPDGAFAPMARSTLTEDGFAPFPNHPLHVLTATGAHEVGGAVGIRMLSVLGTLGAAAAAGWLAAVRSRRHSAVAMWVTALASPLVFHSNLVVAHTLAAALTGAAFVLAFRVGVRGGTLRSDAGVALAVGALIAIGALLRSEVVLLGAVVGVVAGAHGLLGRVRRGVLLGGAAFASSVGVYVLEPRWIDQLVSASPGRKVIAASARGGVAGAREGALTVLFGRGQAGVAVVLAVLLAAAAVLLLRLRSTDPGLAAVLATAGVIAASLTVSDPHVVPGLVWAFPLLAAGAVAVSRRQIWPEPLRRSCQAAALFALFVLATQYSAGGGFEWGWRYVAVALPAVCVALSVPLVAIGERSAPAARFTIAAVAIIGLLVPVGGLLAQRRTIDRVDTLLDRTDEVFAQVDADIIVAADSSFGRYVWPRSIDGDVVTFRGAGSGLAPFLEQLSDRGVDRFLLVWVTNEPAVPAEIAEPSGDVVTLLHGAYVGRAYDLQPNVRSPS